MDSEYLFLWGHYDRLAELHDKLVGHLSSTDLQAYTLGRLADVYRYLGEPERSIEFCSEAIRGGRDTDDRSMQGDWLGSMGRAYLDLGQVEQAISCYHKALAVARETHDRKKEGEWLSHLGNAFRRLGKIKEGIELCSQALVIAQEVRDRRGESHRLGNLGIAHLQLGQLHKASEFFEQALAVSREVGDRWGEGAWLHSLGNVYLGLGLLDRSMEYHEEALYVFRDIQVLKGISSSLIELARASLFANQVERARLHCEEALALDEPDTAYLAGLTLGIVALHAHDPNARSIFVEAGKRCMALIAKTADLHETRYALAASMVGQAVCDAGWRNAGGRTNLLDAPLLEYRRALEVCAAPGVVEHALNSLGLIRAAGIVGLEPAFELLEAALDTKSPSTK
jgi:tetratricopeptide (TPR) repeat protein